MDNCIWKMSDSELAGTIALYKTGINLEVKFPIEEYEEELAVRHALAHVFEKEDGEEARL